MEEQSVLVMPGDKIGVEEEFVAADNTYVDSDGSIRAAILGAVVKKEGKISVVNESHDVRRFKRGMFVLGRVSDDLRAVLFVKLDNVHVNGVEYLPLKDGKIVMSQRRPPMGRERGRGFQPRGGPPVEREQRSAKPCGVGDVIIARIAYDDPEIYTLSLEDNEAGVVYSECELCNTHMEVDPATGTLGCPACEHKAQKKVSALYGKPDQIRKLFKLSNGTN
jgi:exosome complex RNA-binding protein Csl4